jgi:hypothetical protein
MIKILNSSGMLKKDYEFLFSKYSTILNGELKGSSVLIIYRLMMTDPFDGLRTHSIEAGTKLLLSPGVAQIFMVTSPTGFRNSRELKAMLNYARL